MGVGVAFRQGPDPSVEDDDRGRFSLPIIRAGKTFGSAIATRNRPRRPRRVGRRSPPVGRRFHGALLGRPTQARRQSLVGRGELVSIVLIALHALLAAVRSPLPGRSGGADRRRARSARSRFWTCKPATSSLSRAFSVRRDCVSRRRLLDPIARDHRAAGESPHSKESRGRPVERSIACGPRPSSSRLLSGTLRPIRSGRPRASARSDASPRGRGDGVRRTAPAGNPSDGRRDSAPIGWQPGSHRRRDRRSLRTSPWAAVPRRGTRRGSAPGRTRRSETRSMSRRW